MALSANSFLVKEASDVNAVPVAASQTIYHGAMVGEAAGYGQALAAGNKFLGHNVGSKVVSGSGEAGIYQIDVPAKRYRMKVAVTGLVITDVGQPVYATDDATLVMVGAGATGPNSYVGVVKRFVSAAVGIVEFQPGENDEFGVNENRILKADNYTVLTTDSGKIIYIATDAKAITLLAAEEGLEVTLVNAGSFGKVLLTGAINANDTIKGGCGLAAGAKAKSILNTKATANRGDYVTLVAAGSGLWKIIAKRGTWIMEA